MGEVVPLSCRTEMDLTRSPCFAFLLRSLSSGSWFA